MAASVSIDRRFLFRKTRLKELCISPVGPLRDTLFYITNKSLQDHSSCLSIIEYIWMKFSVCVWYDVCMAYVCLAHAHEHEGVHGTWEEEFLPLLLATLSPRDRVSL